MQTPYISVVVAARNDNHGGNMLRRMQAFVDAWISQAQRYRLASEIIVVEWNPPSGRRLIEELRWPDDPGPVEVRFLEVPGEVHQAIPNARTIPLQQMIAKNAGIRRARGEFVLATNLDIVCSAGLMRFLAERRLEPGKMYRIDRTDVGNDIPGGGAVDELLRYCETHILRVFCREGEFELRPNGYQRLDAQDVADPGSGIDLGYGWFPVEWDGRERFRWVENGAEIAFHRPPAAEPELSLDVEPGPSAGAEPLPVELTDRLGKVLAATRLAGRSQLRLRLPRTPRSGWFQLQLGGPHLALAASLRKLDLRVYRMEWLRTPGATNEETEMVMPPVAGVPGAFRLPLELPSVPDSVQVEIKDAGGNVVLHLEAPAPAGLEAGGRYTLDVTARCRIPERSADGRWGLDIVTSLPPKVWDQPGEAPHPQAAEMRRSARLHTNACGDFTLLARDDWFALRGYPEWPIWPSHLDSVFCYTAYHAGIHEVLLREPLRIFHVEHQAIWSPGGESERMARAHKLGIPSIHYDDCVRWVEMMRRLNAPMIFTKQDWGLAGIDLAETRVQPRRPEPIS